MDSPFKLMISTANEEELRRLGEEIGIVHDDVSFEELVTFLKGLIAKRLKVGA